MGQQLPEGPQILETHRVGRRRRGGAGKPRKVASMLQSADNALSLKSSSPASNPNSYNPVKTVSSPVEQATIGRSLVIKGEISGSESLYIDGRIEGKISLPDNRITIGRNGSDGRRFHRTHQCGRRRRSQRWYPGTQRGIEAGETPNKFSDQTGRDIEAVGF